MFLFVFVFVFDFDFVFVFVLFCFVVLLDNSNQQLTPETRKELKRVTRVQCS